MDFLTRSLETVTNWGMSNSIQGGMLETLQAMQAQVDELHRDDRIALRTVMSAFQTMFALE